MLYFIILPVLIYGVDTGVENYNFNVNCPTFNCKSNGKVCGIKSAGEGFTLRLFQDECALVNYKCTVKDNSGYNVTSMFYCSRAFHRESDIDLHHSCEKDCLHPTDETKVCGVRRDGKGFRIRLFRNKCELWKHNCASKVNFTITDFYICNGLELPAASEKNEQLRTVEIPYKNNIVAEEKFDEFKMRDNIAYQDASSRVQDSNQNLDMPNSDNIAIDDKFYIVGDNFSNDVVDHNNMTNLDSDSATVGYFSKEHANQSNSYVFNDDTKTKLENAVNVEAETKNINTDSTNKNAATENDEFKNLVVVHGHVEEKGNVNDTIRNFFSATHVFDLPVEEMPTNYLNETTRRRLIKIAGPLKVFIPLVNIPNNISDDIEHRPTLHSCFHKCPKKCPATYAPVCGVPGRKAREPSLMFLNHCFMDVAQCKQFYENKSPTSISSAYTETTFVFCLGDAMNHMFHFLPLVKTLQHMGRLPKRSSFRYKLSNLKFFNNMLNVKNPNLMG